MALLLCVAPACNATAGHKRGQAQADGSGTGIRQVFRPIFAPAQPRQFYVGGYAGGNYGPLGPGLVPYPTSYHQATGLGPCAAIRFPWSR